MYVIGIGNVTECNRLYIHLNNDGKQERIAANVERLEAIRVKAVEDLAFYERLWQECHTQYEKRKAEADKKYHYITDDDIEAEFKANGRSEKWFNMGLMKNSNNEECIRQFSRVFGWSDACSYALDHKMEAYKLCKQAEGVLGEVYKKQRLKEAT